MHLVFRSKYGHKCKYKTAPPQWFIETMGLEVIGVERGGKFYCAEQWRKRRMESGE